MLRACSRRMPATLDSTPERSSTSSRRSSTSTSMAPRATSSADARGTRSPDGASRGTRFPTRRTRVPRPTSNITASCPRRAVPRATWAPSRRRRASARARAARLRPRDDLTRTLPTPIPNMSTGIRTTPNAAGPRSPRDRPPASGRRRTPVAGRTTTPPAGSFARARTASRSVRGTTGPRCALRGCTVVTTSRDGTCAPTSTTTTFGMTTGPSRTSVPPRSRAGAPLVTSPTSTIPTCAVVPRRARAGAGGAGAACSAFSTTSSPTAGVPSS